MLTKATKVIKTFAALLTLEGFRSSVGVHVFISVPFRVEHFGTEIAAECGWGMVFVV